MATQLPTIRSLEVFLAIENSIVMATAFFGNVLMCISLSRLFKKRLPSNIFILCLVISDLCLSIFQLPVVISSLLNDRKYALSDGTIGHILCNISGVVYFSARQASFFAVCFIALDRFAALRFPLRYKILITYQRSIIATLIAWVICVLIALIPYIYRTIYIYNPVFLYCMWDILTHSTLLKYVDFLFVPTFVISNAVLAFTSLANIIRLHQLAVKERARNVGKSSPLLRASRTALIVVLAFTVCYMPRYILVFFKVDSVTTLTQFWFYYRSISEMLVYFNSAINPLIFLFRSRQFVEEIGLLCNCVMRDEAELHIEYPTSPYRSVPLVNISNKTNDLFSLPKQMLERSRSNTPGSRPKYTRQNEEHVC